jgi:membrane protease YdiL (CAAX protease family)
MNIPENIKEIIDPVNLISIFIFVAGIILFAYWFVKTSFGTKALENSADRRNCMPVFLPLVLIFAILLFIGLLGNLLAWLFDGLQKWELVSINEFTNIIAGLISIVIILFIVRKYFARGLKGFGLNIKTIPKDFVIALVTLIAIAPIMNIVFLVIMFFYELIFGPDYKLPTHTQLQALTENSNLIARILIASGTILVIPFLEELLFRGLLQTVIRSSFYFYKHAAWIAILVTSIFFAMNHENVTHWPILFLLGACMGYSYEKSGSLFRPVFIHMIFNASAIISTWIQ